MYCLKANMSAMNFKREVDDEMDTPYTSALVENHRAISSMNPYGLRPGEVVSNSIISLRIHLFRLLMEIKRR